jgi:thioredoxin reductase (NADPH)
MNSPANQIDVAIIGGGPAGISAALWCSDLGLNSVLIEQEDSLGGQLKRIYNPIDNYLGLRAANGLEMLSHFEKSVGPRNFARRFGIKAASIDFAAMELNLAGAENEKLAFRALIVATGVRRRLLGIRGEIDFRGRGILESGSRDKEKISGKRVLIVGGGDAAFENALILSEFASSVRVAYRRSAPTARRQFLDAAKHRDNIVHLPATNVTAITGDASVKEVDLADVSGRTRTEPVDAVLIRIGVEPNSELARDVLELDELGYIKVERTGRTNVPRVYAVGDVAHYCSPTLITAVGSGAAAAKAIFHSINNPDGL